MYGIGQPPAIQCRGKNYKIYQNYSQNPAIHDILIKLIIDGERGGEVLFYSIQSYWKFLQKRREFVNGRKSIKKKLGC